MAKRKMTGKMTGAKKKKKKCACHKKTKVKPASKVFSLRDVRRIIMNEKAKEKQRQNLLYNVDYGSSEMPIVLN